MSVWFRVAAMGAVSLSIISSPLLPATSLAEDALNVRFSWKLKGEYAHMYLAEERGYFEEKGLRVRIGEGAGSQAALGSLLQRHEDVVIMPGVFALSAIQQGMPIKIIALYHPYAPIVMISHPQRPITEPKDLEGSTIAHSVGATGTSYLGVFCEVNGVDCDSIELVTMASQALVPAFLQGQVDAVPVYASNELPIIERDVGQEFPRLNMADHGLAAPGLAAVSSDDIIAVKPDQLRGFLRAVARGIEDAKADPAAAAEALRAVWPEGPSLEAIEAQVVATMDAIPDPKGSSYGWIDVADMKAALTLLSTDPEFGEPMALEAYYTNDLLEQ